MIKKDLFAICCSILADFSICSEDEVNKMEVCWTNEQVGVFDISCDDDCEVLNWDIGVEGICLL